MRPAKKPKLGGEQVVTEVQVTGRKPEDFGHGVPTADTTEDAVTPAWYLNSASNALVSCDRFVFQQYESFDRKKQRSIAGFAYGFPSKPKGIGSVGEDIFKTKLKDVLYFDGAQLNLVSHSQLEKQAFEMEYRRGERAFKIWWNKCLTMNAPMNHEGMFVLSMARVGDEHKEEEPVLQDAEN